MEVQHPLPTKAGLMERPRGLFIQAHRSMVVPLMGQHNLEQPSLGDRSEQHNLQQRNMGELSQQHNSEVSMEQRYLEESMERPSLEAGWGLSSVDPSLHQREAQLGTLCTQLLNQEVTHNPWRLVKVWGALCRCQLEATVHANLRWHLEEVCFSRPVALSLGTV